MSGSHLWGFMEVSGRPLWVIKNLTLKLYNQTKTNSSPKLFCTRDTFFFRLIVSHAAVQSSSSWFIEQCCTQVWIRSLMNWVFWITRISNQKAILHIQSGLLGEALVTSTVAVENHQLWTTCSLLMQSCISQVLYRHSKIYAVNVGKQKKNRGSKNRVNRGYLVVLKGRKIG